MSHQLVPRFPAGQVVSRTGGGLANAGGRWQEEVWVTAKRPEKQHPWSSFQIHSVQLALDDSTRVWEAKAPGEGLLSQQRWAALSGKLKVPRHPGQLRL